MMTAPAAAAIGAFGLLWLGLLATFHPATRRAWWGLGAASLCTAYLAEIVDWRGAIVLVVLAGATHVGAWALRCRKWGAAAIPCFVVVAIGAGAMLHVLPGIQNVLIADSLVLSSSAAPFTYYWNYDKGVLGLVLLAVLLRSSAGQAGPARTVAVVATLVVLTILIVGPLGQALDFWRIEPKAPAFLLYWLPANLFHTCMAEEAVFRGLVQRGLVRALGRWKPAVSPVLAVVAAAVVFGVAHFAGGPPFMIVATIAGVTYGMAYHRTGWLGAAIATHWLVNVVLILVFTYPAALRP